MLKLFISHRADDSVHVTMALADQLAKHYGSENVIRDSLPLDTQRIRRALEQCDTVLAVIGPRWLDVPDPKDVGRLDNSRDSVQTELRMAFDLGIPVVPVLLDHTQPPPQNELPADIRQLSQSTYWQVRSQNFAADVQKLIKNLSPVAHTSGNVQYNSATGDGKVFANQGGDQVIHWNDGGTKR